MKKNTQRTLAQAADLPVETLHHLLAQPEPPHASPSWPPSVEWPLTRAMSELTTDELRSVVAFFRAQVDTRKAEVLATDLAHFDLFLRDVAREAESWRRRLKEMFPRH